MDDLGIPAGWRECPAMGMPVDRFIPCKVRRCRLPRYFAAPSTAAAISSRTYGFLAELMPKAECGSASRSSPAAGYRERLPCGLCISQAMTVSLRSTAQPSLQVPLGARFDPFIDERLRFNIDMAADQARQLAAKRRFDALVPHPTTGAPMRQQVPAHVGMVIDLTNSKRYYDAQQWIAQDIKYIKASRSGQRASQPTGAAACVRHGPGTRAMRANSCLASCCAPARVGLSRRCTAWLRVQAADLATHPHPRAWPASGRLGRPACTAAYLQIPCQGRGQVPPPEAVTDLCWEMYCYVLECPQVGSRRPHAAPSTR